MRTHDPTLDAAVATMPGLEVLLGPAAVDVLTTANRSKSLELKDVRVTQVSLRPSQRAVVQLRVVESDHKAETVATYVATLGVEVPDGTAVVAGRGHAIGVWRYPHDPFLPGLERVSGGENAIRVLSQLGVDAEHASVRHRSYRPTRRAVLELSSPRARVFVKVVSARRAERIRSIHAALAPALPVPIVRGWSRAHGIVVLEAIEGLTLRQTLATEDVAPEPAAITGLLERFGRVRLEGRPVPRPSDRAVEHLDFLGVIAPSLATLLGELRDGLRMDDLVGNHTHTIHGDLHASQLLGHGGALTGVIDVDRSGPGDPITDRASLLAHLATLAAMEPRHTSYAPYVAGLFDEFAGHVNSRHLRLEAAAAMVGLATGPFRVLEPDWLEATEARLQLARQWVQEADPTGKHG